MPRKRLLDPDFFGDEEITEFPFEARLFYQGTWCFCEDTGVFEVKYKTLKGKIYPHDDIDVKPLYELIRDKGKYIEYQVNGLNYAFIKGFHNRQTIQHPSKSYLPLPPEPFLSLIPSEIRKLNKYKEIKHTHIPLNESSHTTTPQVNQSNQIELSRIKSKDCDSFISLLKGLDLRTKDQVGILNTWCSSLKVRGRCQTFDKCKADFFDIVGKVTKQKPKDFSAYLKKAIDNFIIGK